MAKRYTDEFRRDAVRSCAPNSNELGFAMVHCWRSDVTETANTIGTAFRTILDQTAGHKYLLLHG